MVPRLSSIGRQAAEQAAPAAVSAASSSLLPFSAFAAASTSSTVGATAPSPTRAAVHTPFLSVRLTPQPTTAMSISVRGIMRKYASLDPGGRGGSGKLTRISPGLRWVRPGSAGICSTGISRRPLGPCTVTMAPAAIMAGTLSPAGGAVQRMPPAAARPRPREKRAGRDRGGHTVAGGGAIAEIAARRGAPLDLGGTDQIDGLQHTGPDFSEARMFGEYRSGDGGADAKASVAGFLDRGHFGDFLDVDDQARPHRA